MKKIFYFVMLSFVCASCSQKQPVEETETVASDSIQVEETQTSTDEYQPTHFQNEQDVRAYLCTHSFKSDEDIFIWFEKNANEIIYEDMPVAVQTVISEFNDTMAVIKGSGMLGDSTIKYVSTRTGSYIEDVNDGVVYWEQKKKR